MTAGRGERRVWRGRYTLAVQALFAAALVVCCLVWAEAASAALTAPFRATVVRTVDGDTAHFAIGQDPDVDGRVVGIDTPELAHPGLGIAAECGGQAAADRAAALLYPGRPVWLQYDTAAGKVDAHGRGLFVVRFYRGTKPGRTYERRMLLDGWANEYDYRHQALALKDTWFAQREVARKAVTNAWSCPGPTGNGPSTSIYRAWSTGPARATAASVLYASTMTQDHRAGCMVYDPAVVWGVRWPGAPCGSTVGLLNPRTGQRVQAPVVDNASIEDVVPGDIAISASVAGVLRCRPVLCRVERFDAR